MNCDVSENCLITWLLKKNKNTITHLIHLCPRFSNARLFVSSHSRKKRTKEEAAQNKSCPIILTTIAMIADDPARQLGRAQAVRTLRLGKRLMLLRHHCIASTVSTTTTTTVTLSDATTVATVSCCWMSRAGTTGRLTSASTGGRSADAATTAIVMMTAVKLILARFCDRMCVCLCQTVGKNSFAAAAAATRWHATTTPESWVLECV